MKRRVVITGVGALSPLGNNATDTWEAAKKGVCGIDFIKGYDTSNQKVKVAGELKNFEVTDYLDKKEAKRMDKFVQLGLIAAKEAFKQSGLDMTKVNPHRCGVSIASGIGGLEIIEIEHEKAKDKGFDRVSPFFIPMAISNMASGVVAIEFGMQGSATCIVTACASGTNAIGESFRQIRDGYAEVVIAGGAEATICPLAIGGFTSMRALSESTDPKRASIPFDKERDGFVMGEGAAVMVLEEYEHAVARGANIIAELVGYGSTCDAHHMTAPLEDGSGAARCMVEALADGNVPHSELDYINAHGTSTPLNDKGETVAIKSALGEHAYKTAISSTKSMTGHLLGAAGAVEAIFCAYAIRDSFIPPTVGYKVPDENCDLDIVPNVGREASIRYAMTNSLGFGGHNATLVFKKFEA